MLITKKSEHFYDGILPKGILHNKRDFIIQMEFSQVLLDETSYSAKKSFFYAIPYMCWNNVTNK